MFSSANVAKMTFYVKKCVGAIKIKRFAAKKHKKKNRKNGKFSTFAYRKFRLTLKNVLCKIKTRTFHRLLKK